MSDSSQLHTALACVTRASRTALSDRVSSGVVLAGAPSGAVWCHLVRWAMHRGGYGSQSPQRSLHVRALRSRNRTVQGTHALAPPLLLPRASPRLAECSLPPFRHRYQRVLSVRFNPDDDDFHIGDVVNRIMLLVYSSENLEPSIRPLLEERTCQQKTPPPAGAPALFDTIAAAEDHVGRDRTSGNDRDAGGAGRTGKQLEDEQ